MVLLDSKSIADRCHGLCVYEVIARFVGVKPLILYSLLGGYPASLGFPIMHRVHVICIHPCHNCYDIT